MFCGQYECRHNLGITADDSDQSFPGSDEEGSEEPESNEEPEGNEEPTAEESATPQVTTEYFEDTDYHLTVQFQFDENPEEVSWVLYDLTKDEVKVFVDFGTYSNDEYTNNELKIVVNIDGPEAGEKQYAFTVYDKASNGLCCSHGEGLYKVFLGDEDDDYLLGDGEYKFSSSYYFTLFEEEVASSSPTKEPTLSPFAPVLKATDEPTMPLAVEATDEPTPYPSAYPTRLPTNQPTPSPSSNPTKMPTKMPTEVPTNNPTTAKPTQIWEIKRSEHVDEIGAKWRTVSRTPPGVFNDVGGDQVMYRINIDANSAHGMGQMEIVSIVVLSLGVLTIMSTLYNA